MATALGWWWTWKYYVTYLPHHILSDLRPKGEVAVTHRARQVKLVVSPPGSPITVIYREGAQMIKIGETQRTSEKLGSRFCEVWLGWALTVYKASYYIFDALVVILSWHHKVSSFNSRPDHKDCHQTMFVEIKGGLQTWWYIREGRWVAELVGENWSLDWVMGNMLNQQKGLLPDILKIRVASSY